MKSILLAAVLLAAPAAALADKPLELAAGYRAMAMPFSAHQLRFVVPGDRVDIMTTFEAEFGDKEKKKEEVTATIMQYVRVLAVDRTAGIALLEFNPNEAQYAALFSSRDGSLWLTRRGAGDKELKPMEMASARKLFR